MGESRGLRRAELASQDDAVFREVCGEVLVGYLGLVLPDGMPRSVALNFATLGHDVVFHGALAGEKYELIQARPAAGFTVVKEYAYIPSNWSAPDYACPATQFFKSIEIKGRCEPIDDLQEKADALNALMVKHQPEGNYATITPDIPRYRKALEHVGVFAVRCASWTGKVKFGQNEPEKLRRIFVAKLRERGRPMDDETAREIEKTF